MTKIVENLTTGGGGNREKAGSVPKCALSGFVFLEIFHLAHDFPEHGGTVVRGVPVLDQADFDLQLQGVADALIVQPVGK